MTTPAPRPDPTRDANMAPGRPSRPGMPRWVKVFLIVAVVLVLLIGIVLITGLGGEHGPGRHSPSSGRFDTHTTVARVFEEHAWSGGDPGSRICPAKMMGHVA